MATNKGAIVENPEVPGDDPNDQIDEDLYSEEEFLDEGEQPIEETAKPPAKTPAQAPPQKGAEKGKPVVEKPAEKPQETPQTPEKPTAPQQPATPPQPQQAPETPAEELTPQKALEARNKWRDESMKQLVAHYKIPDKIAETLDPETAQFMSQLAAQVYLDAIENSTNALLQALPSAVMSIIGSRDQDSRNEDEFYAAYPTLDRKADHEVVLQIARAFRHANPRASREDFMKQVGTMALVTLGKFSGNGATETPATTAPQRNFRPARAGGSRPAQGTQKPVNQFEELAESFLEDDRM